MKNYKLKLKCLKKCIVSILLFITILMVIIALAGIKIDKIQTHDNNTYYVIYNINNDNTSYTLYINNSE